MKTKNMPWDWTRSEVRDLYNKGKEESYKQILDEADWDNYYGPEPKRMVFAEDGSYELV